MANLALVVTEVKFGVGRHIFYLEQTLTGLEVSILFNLLRSIENLVAFYLKPLFRMFSANSSTIAVIRMENPRTAQDSSF